MDEVDCVDLMDTEAEDRGPQSRAEGEPRGSRAEARSEIERMMRDA